MRRMIDGVEYVDTAELSQILSVPQSTTRSYARNSGMPCIINEHKAWYPLEECVEWAKINRGKATLPHTLCWNCGKAYALKCSWHTKPFVPVDGWTAIPTTIKYRCYGTEQEVESYCVLRCPEYIPERDQRRRGIG